jgi:hypothetical protein
MKKCFSFIKIWNFVSNHPKINEDIFPWMISDLYFSRRWKKFEFFFLHNYFRWHEVVLCSILNFVIWWRIGRDIGNLLRVINWLELKKNSKKHWIFSLFSKLNTYHRILEQIKKFKKYTKVHYIKMKNNDMFFCSLKFIFVKNGTNNTVVNLTQNSKSQKKQNF